MKDQNLTLAGKRIIVLGGSSGLGFAAAKAAADEGAEVVIVSSNHDRIDSALKALPANASGFPVDLSQQENIKQFFDQAGNFDHLIYSAAANINLTLIDDLDIELGKKYFNLKFWAALTSIKYAKPHINASGSITLTGGTASSRPGSGWGLGASGCGALEGLTRAMAVELAPIRVNLVAPGVVKTNLWNRMSEEQREGMYQAVGDKLLLKRVGEAAEIAQTYLYLMKQQFGTGQVITVDGGTVLV